jgi:hypothetical protein
MLKKIDLYATLGAVVVKDSLLSSHYFHNQKCTDFSHRLGHKQPFKFGHLQHRTVDTKLKTSSIR